MTDREKLVELLAQKCNLVKGCIGCRDRLPQSASCRESLYGALADHLIANGVTVQEWNSVEDKLPKEKSKVLVFWFSNVHEVTYLGDGTFRTLAGQSVIIGRDVKYWMPLPKTPKED